MGAPTQIRPTKPADYLEVLTKAVFQSGMSWRVVEAKWPGFQEAFDGFDPKTVAAMSPDDIDRLAADTRIIRNRRKIEATIENAGTIVEIDERHGGMNRWLDSLGSFDAQVAELTRAFRFLGETGAYYFLYVVGKEVPSHQEWMHSRGPEAGRRRGQRQGRAERSSQ
jgi:3-methyladenine DNA glycosylase Tag